LGWGELLAQKGNYERIDEIPEERHLAVDTSLAAEDNAFRVLKKMFGLG